MKTGVAELGLATKWSFDADSCHDGSQKSCRSHEAIECISLALCLSSKIDFSPRGILTNAPPRGQQYGSIAKGSMDMQSLSGFS